MDTLKRPVNWIDCTKVLAILAVIIDHLKGIIYENITIREISYFSVSVFVFMAGITSFYSWTRKNNVFHTLITNIKRILVSAQ